MIRIMLSVAVLLFAQQAAADDINGVWKHADEPGWIEIQLERGSGTVERNDKFPERVGREILKDLATGSEAQTWSGLIYVEKMGEYKNADIILASPDRMKITVKVGFMSRTIGWQRVDEVPAAP